MAATDGMVEDGKVANDLESAKFTKDKEAVDIVQPTAKLIGLTKEQLEQYRNDPFWKAIRYSLFAAFWLVWLAMFVGAVLIVVLSPKCQQVNWTDKMVAYKVFTLAYRDSDSKNGIGNFAVIEKRLDELKRIGVTAIWPTPVLKYYKNALGPEAIEKLEVSDQLGGADGFKKLVKRAHDNQIKVIVDLPLTVNARENWADNKTSHFKNEIGLVDFNNAAIQDELKGAVRQFLDFAIDGLAVTDYGIFSHTHLDTVVELIRTVPQAEKIPIYSRDSMKGAIEFYEMSPLVGDVSSDEGLNGLRKTLERGVKSIEEEGNNRSRVWQLGSMDPKGHRLDELLGKDLKSNDQKQRISALFSSVHLFMPKPVVVLYGEELGLLSGKPTKNKLANRIVFPWNNETFVKSPEFFVLPNRTKNGDFASQNGDKNSPLGVFREIAKLREHPNFLTGILSHSSYDSFGFFKIKRSHGGFYVLVVNWSDKQKSLNSEALPDELKETKLGTVKVLASSDAVGKDGSVNLAEGSVDVKPYGVMLLDMA